MIQLRSPLVWRLVFWLVLFAIIPLAILVFFMQGQVQTTLLNAQLNTMDSQVRTYSARLDATPDDAQGITSALTSITPNSNFFVLGNNGLFINHSDSQKVGMQASDELGASLVRTILSRDSTSGITEDKLLLYSAYRRPNGESTAVILVNAQPTINQSNSQMLTVVSQVAVGLLIMALAGGVILSLTLSPSSQLAEFVNQLGLRNFMGQLDESKFKGEFKQLASSLSQLSSSIQSLTTELESKVQERTQELEKRANQLRAAADVGKAITSVRNLSELLQQTTTLIQDRFGYYHVGIFLLDDRKEYAVLSATNSEGGRRMLERKHRLAVSETSIVGFATKNTQARIALDVGQDAVFFDNPDLPNTRSEMALPLVASGQTLGALDVQSTEPSAFSQEDIATLQILTDQLAVAIQNANLFNETERALESARQSFGEASREAWQKILRGQPRVGYIATPPTTIETHAETMEPHIARAFESGALVMGSDGLTISIPIKVRGQAIGAIRMKKSEITEVWSQDEINLATALSDQLSGALESARLYRESQQRAVRESLVSDISARISSASRVEAIIRETVQELGQALGQSTVSFQMMETSGGENQADGPVRGERKAVN